LEMLDYDPETGKLYWRNRPSRPAWSAKFSGREAFTAVDCGYRRGQIYGRTHRAHRIIWVMVHGYWPEFIDHINGDRSDNRICNLRAVTRYENMSNCACHRAGAIPGVWKRGNRWQAWVSKDRNRICLGSFRTRSEAVSARENYFARVM
jgi:hypothetical protein